MKFKLLVALVEQLIIGASSEEEHRADMYQSPRTLSGGIVLCLASIVIALYAYVTSKTLWGAFAALALVLGITAIVSWRNETIRIVSETSFEHSNFWGAKKEYQFSEITSMRQNRDSYTLFLGSKKIRIEASAYMSEQFIQKLNEALAAAYPTSE